MKSRKLLALKRLLCPQDLFRAGDHAKIFIFVRALWLYTNYAPADLPSFPRGQ